MKLAKMTEAKAVRLGSWIGAVLVAVLVGAWTVAAAIMCVSFGLWGWVVWPAAAMFFLGRMIKTYAQGKKQIGEVDAKVAQAEAETLWNLRKA